jgi:hypothetical protein
VLDFQKSRSKVEAVDYLDFKLVRGKTQLLQIQNSLALTGGPERKSESEVSTFQGRITRFGSSFLAFLSTNVDFDI